MVAVSIISLLLVVATPSYKRMILKSRAEEAKATIQAIIFAEERYRQEYGHYYPDGREVKSEGEIEKNLKIRLSQSNNFNYFITTERDTGYGGLLNEDGNFTIKALLRDEDWDICTTDSEDEICKGSGAISRDGWVNDYDTGEDRHYILFRYPYLINMDSDSATISSGGLLEGGVLYEYLYQ